MLTKTALAPLCVGALLALTPASSNAASFAATGARLDSPLSVEQVQYWRGRPGPYWRGGPPRFAGGPGWHYRPWYRRPYYGALVAGVALGTVVVVSAYGLAPRPPRPDLCWYWADRIQSRGYWDYC